MPKTFSVFAGIFSNSSRVYTTVYPLLFASSIRFNPSVRLLRDAGVCRPAVPLGRYHISPPPNITFTPDSIICLVISAWLRRLFTLAKKAPVPGSLMTPELIMAVDFRCAIASSIIVLLYPESACTGFPFESKPNEFASTFTPVA